MDMMDGVLWMQQWIITVEIIHAPIAGVITIIITHIQMVLECIFAYNKIKRRDNYEQI